MTPSLTTPVTDDDLATVAVQLGRPARGVVGVAARCRCGAPTVVATRPRLDDGTPFPTFYYLTHPAATAAASALESTQAMPVYAQLLNDSAVAQAYLRAHTQYISARQEYGEVAEIAGVSAGGMPTRVKCLHALAAHSLAVGAGINPIGDRVLSDMAWSPLVCQCAHAEAAV